MVKGWAGINVWARFTEDDYHDMIADVRTAVSCWTENTMEESKEPTLDAFLEYYPEWDHSDLYDAIEKEMERIKDLCLMEAIEKVMYGSDEEDETEINSYPCW
jgi:hypothetical protein